MIKMTDNLYEFRNYILENLIERGYEYIARDKNEELYAHSSKPTKREKSWIIYFDSDSVDETYKNISLLSCMFTDIKWEDEEPFRIPCVNLENMPIDTKVIVTGLDGSEWKCHFCRKLNNNSILVYRDGKTSWTSNNVVEIDTNNGVVEVDINNVRLA